MRGFGLLQHLILAVILPGKTPLF